MNRLVRAGERRWHLPRHAHIVVYDRDEDGLLTIYDCGAAQKPPSAQLLGTLGRIEARHEVIDNPTGRIVKLREESTLRATGDRRYRIATDDTRRV
ncbi:hypothetical protein Halru_2189 [Halovivax ruber XH-70]|uniref:Uncharacterized protein n=1 Tax=Halovivax ruber (strain DSM 18193 / JCM 13892 / XH-70) TaxID=797302 RepID=L0IEY0_HALRX|nr:hypothetical protein [Halovivax ruber]AGB16776.1 hypothetical protein Halru_2189 [Halovivax ruber XH-70]